MCQLLPLNMGAIKGGDNANRICGHCDLDLDFRSLPGMNDDEILHLVKRIIKTVSRDYILGVLALKNYISSSPSFEQEKHCRSFRSVFVSIAEEISGHTCCAVNYATEAPFIQQLGCQTISIRTQAQ